MRIVLTPEEYEDFVAVLEGPPRQCPKLVKLMTTPAPWEDSDGPVQDRNPDHTV